MKTSGIKEREKQSFQTYKQYRDYNLSELTRL
jgi:hypothetical protein